MKKVCQIFVNSSTSQCTDGQGYTDKTEKKLFGFFIQISSTFNLIQTVSLFLFRKTLWRLGSAAEVSGGDATDSGLRNAHRTDPVVHLHSPETVSGRTRTVAAETPIRPTCFQ